MKVRMMVEQTNIDSFINQIVSKYHYSDKDKNALRKVYDEIIACIGPYASYRINQRVTGISVIDDNQSAVVAMTLGIGVDRLADKYMSDGKIDEAYMIDCIANELMLGMYTEFNQIYARFHRRYVQRYVFIGNEIPLTNIPEILDEIKGRKNKNSGGIDAEKEDTNDVINADNTSDVNTANVESDEITSNEYGVLLPSKSVVFYAVLSDNPSTLCEGICSGCKNENCENRMSLDIQNKQGTVGPNNSMKKEDISDRAKANLNYGYQRIFGTNNNFANV